MCYSALIEQNLKKLAFQYKARIDESAFETLFKERQEGSAAKISRVIEDSFLDHPQISKLILDWRRTETTRIEKDLFTQDKRLADAERALLVKTTKKAQEDQRIATDKIAKFKLKLEDLKRENLIETDYRIYPHSYAPIILLEKGERVIKPFRYHLRPEGQGEDFDRKFDGCYNVRRDSLDRVFWWKNIFGKHHAFMVMKRFYENVEGPDGKNQILEFSSKSLDQMVVPCIFDQNKSGKFVLNSFALITDEPNPEVAAAGHDRTPIIMREEYLDLWLNASENKKFDFEVVFKNKQPTFFEHRIAA